jgi:hypothetical protein
MDAEQRAALDTPARSPDRDRSYLINDAVDAYLAMHRGRSPTLRQACARSTPASSPPMRKYRRTRAGGDGPLTPARPSPIQTLRGITSLCWKPL